MRKKMRNTFLAFALVLAAFLSAAGQVTAAVQPPISRVPVSITLEGTQPAKAETYVVKLVADSGAEPMPEGSKDGVYALEITGAGKKDFPDISFNRVGIYNYTIFQEAGADKSCTYDKSVYDLTVYVTNAENGGLEATSVLYKNDGAEKLQEVSFKNVYPSPTKPDPQPDPEEPDDPTLWKVEKVWNDAGFEASRPANITIRLLCNGKVYDTVTVDASMNWSYGWLDLDEKQSWTVEEEAVAGYVSSVTQNGKRFTITNTILPAQQPDTTGNAASGGQTGDASAAGLWLVLLAGAAAVAAVVIGKRRRV